MKREPSSYRDPDGYIAYINGDVHRCVLNKNAAILQDNYQDFFKEAVSRGLLVPFTPANGDAPDGGALLKLDPVPLISYPYEWGFEQLKDAALLTLDICLLALDYGLTLKDATAFNAQQYKGRMIFIDHTSFEPSDNTLPWRPYSQFCKHFLAPLWMISYRGFNANKHFCTHLDGIELSEACVALPFFARFKPAIFLHIYLHNYLINANKNKKSVSEREVLKKKAADGKKPVGNQKAYLEHLKRVVEGIKPPKYDTEWHDYYHNTNYDAGAFEEKEAIIEKAVSGKKYKCVWDVGGNNGHFSRIISKHADMVVSMDIDYAAVDLNYRKNRKDNVTNSYPLVLDLSNPSPALGFANEERKKLEERSKPDMIVALAVIHHLTVTYNIPFQMLAEYFSSFGADVLLEFVDREDSQFQKLLTNKSDAYPHYTKEAFEAAFSTVFEIEGKTDMANKHRCLYSLKPKRQ